MQTEPHPDTPLALSAVDVSKTFPDGTRALDRATLGVPEGATVALLGESGCGKSTLLRLFNGLTAPDSGEVRVRGREIAPSEWVETRRQLGYVPQDGGLLPHWTVEQNVGLVPRLLGWPAERRADRVREVLALVGLEPERFFERRPLELSGGQRQRVSLARALAGDPPIVLLDEPFGALDAITRLGLRAEFDELRRTLGKSVLLVTHDLDEAFRLADAIAVMRDGAVQQIGSVDELTRRPATPYVARLLELRTGRIDG